MGGVGWVLGGEVLGERRGSPERFMRVGIEGPKMSVSRIPLLRPCRAKARARFTVAVSQNQLLLPARI